MDPVNNDAVQRALVVQDMLIAHQVSETWSTLQSLSSSVVGLLGQERTAPPVQPPALSASSRASFSALGTSMFCLTLPFPSVTQMTWTDVGGLRSEPPQLVRQRQSFSPYASGLCQFIQFRVLDTVEDLSSSVFSKQHEVSLPPHQPYDCSIDLPGAPLPSSHLYSLSRPEREANEKHIGESLEDGVIWPSSVFSRAGYWTGLSTSY
ncbi:hypothetical protein D4764_02G0000140 [Takifugu flavidus]|uniref:Uncharacterized protein n=1 Tax=Takifugu flavidus TaxID=433684 RepID=A0A5C6NID0_9TELE|nr:hypothetical protein D4764_02G0000140 [Takifugu flavidus]